MKLHKKKKSVLEYPYVWNRAFKPEGRLGQPCKRVGWENKSQGLAIIQFTDGKKFIVQKSGLQLRTPTQNG